MIVGGPLADIADYLGAIVQHLLWPSEIVYFDNVPIYQHPIGNTTHAFGIFEYGALYGVRYEHAYAMEGGAC